jgi:formate-dependent nitrite reductase cytochrome c552 subunit
MQGLGMAGTRSRVSTILTMGLAVLLLAALPATAASKKAAPSKPTNDDCLACHSDNTLATERNGKQVSLFVNPDSFKASIHGGMFACVDCHTDVKTSPHENTPAKITCAQCHADEQAAYEKSFHAKA